MRVTHTEYIQGYPHRIHTGIPTQNTYRVTNIEYIQNTYRVTNIEYTQNTYRVTHTEHIQGNPHRIRKG